jgi:zinc finger-containing ubiquitin peptidase 1
MPTRLRMHLENDDRTGKSEAAGIIEVLGRLCDQDTSVETAYLCHPVVQRISKTRQEGNLCGYRNIQMMISYLIGAEAQGSRRFSHKLPSVLGLQDLIEEAWDKGINSEGRVETGGIRGTRKYIGTAEVCNNCFKPIQTIYELRDI